MTYSDETGLASGGDFKLEVVRSLDGIAALRPHYARLLELCANTLPFSLHEWHLTWCRYFLNQHAHIRDEPLFHVVRSGAGLCVAIIPFILSRRQLGPVNIASLSLLGSDPAITEIRAPLIAPGYEAQTARLCHATLRKMPGWDWIQWSGITGPFGEGLARYGELHWQTPLSSYVLDLAPTWEEFRARLKRNIRESLRHGYNSLKREGHVFEMRVVTDPADVPQCLERFLDLHAKRAESKRTTNHPNRFESRVSQNFLLAICKTLAESGNLRIFELRIGAQAVAMRIGFVVGGSLYLYYSGFDPAWGRFGVMTTTVAEAIKYSIAHGLMTVNLSPGTDVSKTRWGPREVQYRVAFEDSGRLRSRVASRAYLRARNGAGLQSRLLNWLVPARRIWK